MDANAGSPLRLLLNVPEAAAALSVGRSTLDEMIADGQLPVVRFGRAVRVPVSELTTLIEQRKSVVRKEETDVQPAAA